MRRPHANLGSSDSLSRDQIHVGLHHGSCSPEREIRTREAVGVVRTCIMDTQVYVVVVKMIVGVGLLYRLTNLRRL
jgi:hypothetical protein